MKAALLLIGAFLLCGGTLCGQSIPITRAISLADTTVTLPGDLKGRPAILVLGFSKNSSQQTKPWTEAIERDFESQEKIAFYQLPMLQEVPRLVRSFVLQGMRKPLNTAQRSHFLPVFDNGEAWKSAVHFAGADDAYVLLVDGSGRIQWQASGAFQEEQYDGLRKRAAAVE